MVENYEKEAAELLEKHLPAKATEAFKARIAKVESLENEVKALKNRDESQSKAILALNETTSRLLADLDKMKSALVAWEIRENELKRRERTVEDKARQLEIDLLKKDVECQKEQKEFAKSMGLGLVRNTEFRNEVFGNMPLAIAPQGSNNGNYTSPAMGNTGQTGFSVAPVSQTTVQKKE